MFFVQPQYTEIVAIQDQTSAYKSASERYNEFSQKLQSLLSTKNNRTLSENERLDLFSASAIDVPSLVVDLEAMAGKSNLLFGNIATESGDSELGSDNEAIPEDERGTEQLITEEISFDVIGTYEQFKSFLQDLESSVVIMEIINIKFATGESVFQQFSVTVRTYALPIK
jgi:Tfp pilus assembly protein PilO